jgi:type II secretory pathway pseudopilin PulG
MSAWLSHHHRTPRECRAFTLVEAVASIAVLAVIGSVSSSLILNSVDGYADAAASAQLHSEASAALERIERELRSIELDAAAAGIAPNIDSVTASSIAWHGDSSLSLSGTNLMLAADGGAAAVLASDVAAFTIQTFDESNNALAASLAGTACDPIRRIRIELTLSRHGVSEFLRTRFHLRATIEGAG